MAFENTRPWPILDIRTPSESSNPDLWRSLYFFNLYRLALATVLLVLPWLLGTNVLGQRYPALYFQTGAAYLLLALASFPLVRLRRPTFNKQLGIQIGTDIVCIVLLYHSSGGSTGSNLNVLLLVSLAAAGLISRGRITLFFAALASIAVLLEHGWSILTFEDVSIAQFMQAGVLSIAYFAVAWVAHRLSRYAVATEKLAASRGEDVSYLEEANRLVIRDMPDGVLLVDERGVVKQANPGAVRLLGVRFSGEGKETLNESAPLLGALYGVWRQSRANRDEVLYLPNTHFEVRVRFVPVQRVGFAGAVVVIEDMQRAQAEAQQVKLAALGRLTANIAHEVRNPLSSISYAAELLQEGEKLEGQERLINIILDNATRLNNIVLDVLQLNRRDRAQKENFRLAEFFPNFIENLQHTENVTEGIIRLDFTSECSVLFDRGHFDQVMWNLCRNAVRYCQRQQGSVSIVSSCEAEGRPMLEICNDGGSIPNEMVQRLFEPFFTTSSGGTGLGLYIARELCDANGAKLEYRPAREEGACFRIIFGAQDEN